MQRPAKVMVFALLLFMGTACAPPAGRPKPGTTATLAAPEYHQPRESWRADHAVLIHGPRAESQGFFQVEECLFCHRPTDSCNQCHSYVGVAPVATGDKGSQGAFRRE